MGKSTLITVLQLHSAVTQQRHARCQCPGGVSTRHLRGAGTGNEVSQVGVSSSATICDLGSRCGQGKMTGWDTDVVTLYVTVCVIDSSVITNSKARTKKWFDLREKTLATVKRQNSLFLQGPGSSPQMHEVGGGTVFPASPLICLSPLLGFRFPSSRDGHREPFVRHWPPQALTFSGEGLPSAPETARGYDPRALDSCVLCQGQGHPQVWGLGAAKEAVRLGR